MINVFWLFTVLLVSILCYRDDSSSHPAIKMCDVSHLAWSTKTWIAQRHAVKSILKELLVMENGSNLMLFGFPLLTQLNVGLVFVLGHVFQEVCMCFTLYLEFYYF